MGSRRKNVKTPTAESSTPQDHENVLPSELQQIILNHFSLAFPFSDAADLKSTIQTVKGHLYDRDFSSAFGRSDYLDAYAVRWSAARALGYADLVLSLTKNYPHLMRPDQRQVLCIGGGAGAELVALAATIARTVPLTIAAIDIADWSGVLSRLQRVLTAPAPLSAYASAAAKEANQAFIQPDHLDLNFVHKDILSEWDPGLREKVRAAGLVTVMFTLNELFTASRAKTTRMLLDLTEHMQPDSYLLVVDSPGSYSEVSLGAKAGQDQATADATTTKKYPMKWMLDHTLTVVVKEKWEKVLEDDSRWFRVAAGLKYPIELENMRYQLHLYKRS